MTAAEIALGAALALGLPAFPCRRDKAPACPHGFRDATTNPVGLRDLWRRCPGPLVGVPTGDASGRDVLDIDAPRHPEAAEWWHRHQQIVPATRIHLTRSGGVHVLFRHARGLRCWAGRPVPGVDGRADGGYVVWWPATGERVMCGAPLAPWPEWLLGELIPPTATRPAWPPATDMPGPECGSHYSRAALRHATDRVARAPVGARNSTLNAEAFGLGRLVAAGLLDIQDVADTLAAAAIAAGLAPGEVEATLRSALAARGLL